MNTDFTTENMYKKYKCLGTKQKVDVNPIGVYLKPTDREPRHNPKTVQKTRSTEISEAKQ